MNLIVRCSPHRSSKPTAYNQWDGRQEVQFLQRIPIDNKGFINIMLEFNPTTNEIWIRITAVFAITMLIVAGIYLISQIFM